MVSDKKMIEYVVQEWNRDDVYIMLPRDTKPIEEWFKATKTDVRIKKDLGNIVKPEWQVQVHNLFNLHVRHFPLKNKWTIEQIDFDAENLRDEADKLK